MSAVFFSRADQTPPPVDHVLLPAQPFHSPSPPCSPRPHSRHTSPTRYIVPTINGRVVRGFGRAFLYLSIYLSIPRGTLVHPSPPRQRTFGWYVTLDSAGFDGASAALLPSAPSASTIGHARRKTDSPRHGWL